MCAVQLILGPRLATCEDADGWCVTIYDGAPQLNGRLVSGPLSRLMAMARSLIWSEAWTGRNGTTVITAPTGQQVVSGYWMDWREVEWGLSWLRYRTMTRRNRASLEVHQQATAYLPLSEGFQSAWAYPDRRLLSSSEQITW